MEFEWQQVSSSLQESSQYSGRSLVTIPRVQIAIGRNVNLTFHSCCFFFNSLVRPDTYLSFRFLSSLLCISRDSKMHNQGSFFLLIITRSDRLAEIKGSVFISKFLWSWCVSFSRTDSGLCIYYLFVWSNFNSLHNSQWITLSRV